MKKLGIALPIIVLAVAGYFFTRPAAVTTTELAPPPAPPTQISAPPAPLPDDPNLAGVLYSYEKNFAVWNNSQVAFFDLPDGMLLPGQNSLKTYYPNMGRGIWGPTAFVCAPQDVDVSSECTKRIFPQPTKIVKSEVLNVEPGQNYNSPAQFLLISTERYRLGRNTALNPVAEPFYAIYDLKGNEKYRLPKLQTSSGTYVFAMGMDPVEPAALFGIGGLMDTCGAEEDLWVPANVTEVFLWTAPDKLKKIDTRTRTPEVDALMKRFGLREHWFPFFKWPEERHGC